MSLRAKVVLVCAGVAGALLSSPAVSAAELEPALVRASEQNECRLNVRTGPEVSSPILTTLSCVNYTTCVNAESTDLPCGPYVEGGEYSCVGADGEQVTDNRWADVAWRAPQPSYVAVSCATFRF
ncbi:hypothetical protein ABZ863_08225 [Saccharomonospora sp. NPDC046836]|uniref:hypothetical protein n=1 Tax=Saccharomonospora sp. NPDC046836 TaxID=3156921 RepID=UPI0033EEF289